MKRHPEDLLGRTAIVTGAGNGLGLGIGRRFAEGGARVLLVDQDPIVLTRAGEEKSERKNMFALVKDLAEPDAAAQVFEHAKDVLGDVDTLINNAAWSFHKPMLEVTTAEFDRVVAINQRAPFFLAQEFLRGLAQAKVPAEDPAIVNISSVNALMGNPNLVAYSGTKGALAAMTRTMAVEMADSNVRVNSVCPAAIDTFVTKQLVADGVIEPASLFKKYLIKRFASCEEIAELVAYLCSDASRYVTGANWEIDGGYTAK
jgi:NAD(P)-dependent dehydrogenase (short-subunit alcohol dehydrogenase family)